MRRSSLDRAVEEATLKYNLAGKVSYSQEGRCIILQMTHGRYSETFLPHTEKKEILAWFARCIRSEQETQEFLDEKKVEDMQDRLI